MQAAQNYSRAMKNSSFLGFRVSFSSKHGSISAPVTRSSVYAESHYANSNDLLNCGFHMAKTICPSVAWFKGHKALKSFPIGRSVGSGSSK